MKTYLYIAVAALTLAACSNDENESRDNWNGEIRLSTANIAVPASRSISQDLQLTQFDADEQVDVFINENIAYGETASTVYAQPLTSTADGNAGLAFPNPQYFPQSGNGVNIIAVYPSGVANEDIEASVDFSIQLNQSEDKNYKASDLMYGVPSINPVARTKEAINLNFTHKLSKIDINLIVGDGNPTLIGATVNLKQLLPTIGFSTNTGKLTDAKGEKKDVIAADKNIEGTLTCSAIIIPQAVDAGTPFIEVTLPQGGILTYKLENATTFTSGKKYTYNITVNLTELTATTTIEDWTDGGTKDGTAEME